MMIRSAIVIFALIAQFILFQPYSTAQDSHYWSNQYGTRSSLLGGTVVGSVRDTSAGYYNPGALAFIENEHLSVSANAIRFESVSVDNGAGTGDDLDSKEVQVVPLLISGIKRFEELPDHTFGYSLITRTSNHLNFSDRRDTTADILSGPFAPGNEDYIGQYAFESDINEYWAGLSWATKGCSDISFGISNFLALRSEESRESTSARAINQQFAGLATTTDQSNLIDLNTLRILWKAGVSADFSPFQLGLVVTTPSINIYGDGTSARDFTSTGIDLDDDGFADPLIANDRQDDLDAEFRTPFSLAGGVGFEASETTKLHASFEWFGPQGFYNVAVPESRDFLRPTGSNLFDSKDFLLIRNSAEAVVNWGIGIEQVLSEKVTGYFSVRSDYESVRKSENSGFDLGISSWDIYHATVGTTWKRENSEIGIGLVYSFGTQDNFVQPVNFGDPTVENFVLGASEKASVDYDAISIILGYTYFIQ